MALFYSFDSTKQGQERSVTVNADVFSDVAPASRNSSISFLRIIGSMFMRVNSKCAHQVRPPPGGFVRLSAL